MIELFTGYIIISGLSIIVIMLLAKNAPIGYEDEHGFHYGEPPKK